MTWIGDNVFISMHAIVLMGTRIGDNSIVGAGAVVSGKFPDGVGIAGNPAKIICTIEEYAEKRRGRTLDEAVMCARNFKLKYGQYPTILEMKNAFAWLYLPRTKESIAKYPQFFKLSGVDLEQLKEDFLNSRPRFESYEQFWECVDKRSDEE